MTHNQINYWNLQETKRSNVANEKETNRHNVATETETNRHNVATERIDLGKLSETQRHNLATEGLTGRELDIKQGTLNETIRSNQAREAEASRHNLADENISQQRVGLDAGTLSELHRHNLAQEGLTGTDLSIKQQEANTRQFSAYSNADLNAARAQLLNIQQTWEGLQRSKDVELTDAKIRQINKLMEEVNANISYLGTREAGQKINNAQDFYNFLTSPLNQLTDAVDALIPG